MNFSTILIAALSLASTAIATDPSVANQYIIRLNKGASRQAIRAHLSDYNRKAELMGNGRESAQANHIKTEYTNVLRGFAGTFSQDYLASLKAQMGGQIRDIIPNAVVHHYAPISTERDEQQAPPSWGLTRISQKKLDLQQPYRYPVNAGLGVDVWVVDTGINTKQKDFGGRASMNATFIEGEEGVDLNGHGTHCAGTVGSATYGIAKKANLFGVKVLSGSGSGTLAGVIAGIDHVSKYVRKGKTVISMSLGGGKNDALNEAVTKAVQAGIVVIVAAGNESQDACNVSPASAKDAFTVGATDNTDTLARFSNKGSCVRIQAPGVNIKSLWVGDDGTTKTISGTSMATPHVAGVAASLMSQKDYNTPQEVYADLIQLATRDTVKSLPNNTVNALLYNGASDEQLGEPVTVPVPPTA